VQIWCGWPSCRNYNERAYPRIR